MINTNKNNKNYSNTYEHNDDPEVGNEYDITQQNYLNILNNSKCLNKNNLTFKASSFLKRYDDINKKNPQINKNNDKDITNSNSFLIIDNPLCGQNYQCIYISNFFYLLDYIFNYTDNNNNINTKIIRNYILKLDYVMNLLLIMIVFDILYYNKNILTYKCIDKNFISCDKFIIEEELKKKEIEDFNNFFKDSENINPTTFILLQKKFNNFFNNNDNIDKINIEYSFILPFINFKNIIKFNNKNIRLFTNNEKVLNLTIFHKIIYIYNILDKNYDINNNINKDKYFINDEIFKNIKINIYKIYNYNNNNNNNKINKINKIMTQYRKNLRNLNFFKNEVDYTDKTNDEQSIDNEEDNSFLNELIKKVFNQLNLKSLKENVNTAVKFVINKVVQLVTGTNGDRIIIAFTEEPFKTALEIQEYVTSKEKYVKYITSNVAEFMDMVYQNFLLENVDFYLDYVSENINEKKEEYIKSAEELENEAKIYLKEYMNSLNDKKIDLNSLNTTVSNNRNIFSKMEEQIYNNKNNIDEVINLFNKDNKDKYTNIINKIPKGGNINNNDLYYKKYMKYKLKYNNIKNL